MHAADLRVPAPIWWIALLAVAAWAAIYLLLTNGFKAALKLSIAVAAATLVFQGGLALATGWDPLGTLQATHSVYTLGTYSITDTNVDATTIDVAPYYSQANDGARLNLGRFFELTSIALALVAGGLVMSAIHTAHEAGWFNGLQGEAVNLSWLVRPGTVSSSLLTGVLGLQPRPTVGESADSVTMVIQSPW